MRQQARICRRQLLLTCSSALWTCLTRMANDTAGSRSCQGMLGSMSEWLPSEHRGEPAKVVRLLSLRHARCQAGTPPGADCRLFALVRRAASCLCTMPQLRPQPGWQAPRVAYARENATLPAPAMTELPPRS